MAHVSHSKNKEGLTLGQKVKMLRAELGLTQKELCKDFITRNMLSLIESDSTLPSAKTLVYLSDRLGVSPAYFFDTEEDPFIYRKIRRIKEILALKKSKKYDECIKLCLSLSGVDDEIAYILSTCYFELGFSFWKKGDFKKSDELFSLSEEYIPKTSYETSWIVTGILSCRHFLKVITDGSFRPDFPIPSSPAFSKALEFNLYIYMLKVTETCRYDLAARIYDTMRFFENEAYKLHINARLSLASKNYQRAITLLNEIVSLFDERDYDTAFRISILLDLENAYRSANDYEGAYKCAILREDITKKS